MKRRIITMFLVVVTLFVLIPKNVFASTNSSVKANLSVSSDKILKGQALVITLGFDDYKDFRKGINSYKGMLEYDEDIFEVIDQNYFVNKNNWENLKYNPDTKEFIAIKRASSKTPEEVVDILLMAKKDANLGQSTVKISDIVVSDGKKDTSVNDVSVNFELVNEISTDEVVNQEVSKVVYKVTDKIKTVTLVNKKDDDDKEDVNNSKENINNDDNKLSNSDKEVKNDSSKMDHMYIFIFAIVALSEILLFIYFIVRLQKNNNNNNSNNSSNNNNNSNNNNSNNSSNNNNNSDTTTNNNNSNFRMFLFIILGAMFLQLAGGIYVAASSLAGFSNDNTQINYDDVEILQLYIIHLLELNDNDLNVADINGDGKITMADLTLMVQTIENILDYEVTLSNIEINKIYPTKGEEIIISFNAEVTYDALLESIVINNQEYEVEKINDFDNRYTVRLSAGVTSGVKEYKITHAILNNLKTIDINYVEKVDVLKNVPTVNNYQVLENVRDQKLNVTFDLEDKDNSIISAKVYIYDENKKLIKVANAFKGKNKVEIDVLDRAKYQLFLDVKYDLDTNTLKEENHTGNLILQKEMVLVTNYDIKINNIKTYSNGLESNYFEKDENIQVSFESTNNTKYVPVEVVINGIKYNVIKYANSYIVNINGLTNTGNNQFTIQKVLLSNGRTLEISDSQFNVYITKQKPTIDESSFKSIENVDDNYIDLEFTINDSDSSINSALLALYDDNLNLINSKLISKNEIISQSKIYKRLTTRMSRNYKVKLIVNYSQTDEEEKSYVLLEKDIVSKPRAIITNAYTSVSYFEKGGIVFLTYEVSTNKLEKITKIHVNDTDCMTRKLSDGRYQLIYQASKFSGLQELKSTKVTFSDNTEANVSNVVKIDVLKDKPIITNIEQEDDELKSEITFNFDVIDNDNSFISGKAVLTNQENGLTLEKEIVLGHNNLTFNCLANTNYKLEFKYSYDRDTNALENLDENDNKVLDELVFTKDIYLDVVYKFTVSNINTYDSWHQTKYFTSDEVVIIRFNRTNDSNVDPSFATINGKKYAVIKNNDMYEIRITGRKELGFKYIILQSVELSNGEVIEILENNKLMIDVVLTKLYPSYNKTNLDLKDEDIEIETIENIENNFDTNSSSDIYSTIK